MAMADFGTTIGQAYATEGAVIDLGHDGAHDLARAARDARLGPIGGGTDEIMKEILGKTLGL